jgi:hypothetical protein
VNSPTRITDVAEAAGVSPTTVSNVLNRPHMVAAGTSAKVRKVIQQLKYVPNPHAAALPKGRLKPDPARTSASRRNPSQPLTGVESPSDLPDTETSGSSEKLCLDWKTLQGGELVDIMFSDGNTGTGLVDAVMPDGTLIWLWMDNGQGRTLLLSEDDHRISARTGSNSTSPPTTEPGSTRNWPATSTVTPRS